MRQQENFAAEYQHGESSIYATCLLYIGGREMGKRKSHFDYAVDLEQMCADDADRDKIWRCAGKWAERVPLNFFVASNEQKPYTVEDLSLIHI